MKNLALILLTILSVACVKQSTGSSNLSNVETTKLYSKAGREVKVQFSAKFRSIYKEVSSVKNLSSSAKQAIDGEITRTLRFLFGPLNYWDLGGAKRDGSLEIKWNEGVVSDAGVVDIPYVYTGSFMLVASALQNLVVPLPLNETLPFSPNWKSCYQEGNTEEQYEHVYWYHYDPKLPGCDQVLGTHYQEVNFQVLNETPMTVNSYPEYSKLLNAGGKANNLQITFAFGYAVELSNPQPLTDADEGMTQFRMFLDNFRKEFSTVSWQESVILQGEYLNSKDPQKQIGVRFTGVIDGVQVKVNVVTETGLNQMQLFSKSFAHDHDSFFGWFGHSHLGDGFAPGTFSSLLSQKSSYYSVSPNYQLLFFGSCNSYSYYTRSYFKMKRSSSDPMGTKGLDIISNGVASYFATAAANAMIFSNALLNFKKPTSYQVLVDNLQETSKINHVPILVNVQGDEDNSK
jgi:hypothetical protein